MFLIPWSRIHEKYVLIKLVYAYGVIATFIKGIHVDGYL